MQRGVRLDSAGPDFPGQPVDAPVAGLGFEEWGDDFAVSVEQPIEVGMGPRAGTVGVEQSELTGLVDGELTVQFGECGKDVGAGEIAGAPVEVVMAPHRLRWQVELR